MNIIRKGIAILVFMTPAASAWAESTTNCTSGEIDLGVIRFEKSTCTTTETK